MTVSTATKAPAANDVRAATVIRPLNSLLFVGLATQTLALGLCAISVAGIDVPGQSLLPFAFLAFLGLGTASLILIARGMQSAIVTPLDMLATLMRTGRPPAEKNGFLARDDIFGALGRKLTEPKPAPAPAAPVAVVEQKPAGLDEASRAALAALEKALLEFAEGNFAHRIDAAFPAEIDGLKASYGAARKRIAGTLNQVSQTVDGLGTGVSEIVSASDDLSRRTERQAVALEETVSTLGTVVQNVRTSAGHLKETSSVATSARNDAEKSGHVVDEALAAMKQIEDSATQINKIITVIDEIAFQTNLLALNAGVEAARAGDAGQGFAVVASEVRALAQRSATAAREISSLITQSTQQIANGSRLVNETGTALKRISDHVLNISQNVQTITESAQEQSRSLDSLNSSAVEMDSMTQQNAAMAEEVTAASYSLQRSTEDLSALLREVHAGHKSVGAVARRPEVSKPASQARSLPRSSEARTGAELRTAAAALKSGSTGRFSDLAARGQRDRAPSRPAETKTTKAPVRAASSRPPAGQFAPNLTLGNAAIDEDWEEF